jgi:hypothetical protein
MRKILVSMTAALLLGVSTANAAVYKFTFDSSDARLTAAGQITVDTAGEVTGVSGAITGLVDQTITGVAANPSFPGPSLQPRRLVHLQQPLSCVGRAPRYRRPAVRDGSESGRVLEPMGKFARQLFALGVRRQLQLPGRGEWKSERDRRAGTVDLGDAGGRLRGSRSRRPPPPAGAASGARPWLAPRPATPQGRAHWRVLCLCAARDARAQE